MTYALIVLALLQAADGWTTWQVIRFGGVEADPIMKAFMRVFGTYWALVITKVAVVAVFWFYSDRLPLWFVTAVIGLFVAVVVNNLIALKKQKAK